MAAKPIIDRDAIAAFCRAHGVRRLSSFGSVLRDGFGPDSDIDVHPAHILLAARDNLLAESVKADLPQLIAILEPTVPEEYIGPL